MNKDEEEKVLFKQIQSDQDEIKETSIRQIAVITG